MTSADRYAYQMDLIRVRAREKKVFAYIGFAICFGAIIWAVLSLR